MGLDLSKTSAVPMEVQEQTGALKYEQIERPFNSFSEVDSGTPAIPSTSKPMEVESPSPGPVASTDSSKSKKIWLNERPYRNLWEKLSTTLTPMEIENSD